MIKINSMAWVKNEDEMLDVVFDEKLQLQGFYKERKNEYILKDLQNNIILAIRKQDNFLMSCKKLENKKLWFSYLDSKKTQKYDNKKIIIL